MAPSISVYAYHNGSFDYNRMPLAPMGCAVQFHIKPAQRKTFEEHSSNGWYLQTSPKHYRCHIVFVKATKRKQITDTVFFKHKYLTQPTVTHAGAIVNAYHNLVKAIQGLNNTKNQAHFEAIQRIQDNLAPGNQKVMEKHAEQRPRVEHKQTVHASEPLTATPPPRVSFQEQIAEYDEPRQVTPTRMIVASPQEPVVVLPKPSILKPPRYDEKPDTIAARLKARRNKAHIVNDTPEETIADRVARRRREATVDHANPVLNQETGKLLKYRQLLHHLKYKAVWNPSAANEFGRLAQGIGGRVKGTDTVRFIHKHEVPADRFKDVTYIKFVCKVRTEKKDPTEQEQP